MSNYVLRNCLILMNFLLTWSCDQGQSEVEGICITCSSNCTNCTFPYSCDSCMPGFYVTAIFYQCGACQNGCEVCTVNALSIKTCQTCFPKFYKSGSNCFACPTYCATCTSSSVCQSCLDHYFLSSNLCYACDSSCKACSNTSNICTECDVGKFLQYNSCEFCLSPCSACIGDSLNCTACIDNKKKVVLNQCVCKDGYYADQLDQCVLCTAPCSKCETDASTCTECISGFTLNLSTQQCACAFGYCQVGNTCQESAYPCETCVESPNKCLTCVDINQIVTDSNECICQTGWILNTNGNACVQCQAPCAECITQISKCVTCKDELHQQLDTCQCDIGWMFDINFLCIACQQPCKTCEIITTNCLTCLDVNQELNSAQQCVCKPTYYSDTLNTCAQCQEPCYECDANGCINCIDTNQVLNSYKECVCKEGYLQQGTQCLHCTSPCSTCIISLNACLTCFDPNQIVDNHQCICKEGFVQKDFYCCDRYCIDCQGINNCNNCIKGFYLSITSRCLQCIDHCDVCNNQNSCENCQVGYFLNQSYQCELCNISCQTCSNKLSCDTCLDGYYLIDSKCEPCNQNCLTCRELPQKCLTCKSNYEINPNYQCVCIVGYYEQQNQCFKCEYPCNRCLDKTTCQECVQLSNLKLGMNFQCNCNSGYYWFNNSCYQCYQSCLTCIDNQFNCLSCDQRLHRYLENNKCLCDSNYFESEDGFCISCLDQLGKSQQSCKIQDCQDQIWTYGEECDDGNDVIRDGCSNCKIDPNYSCSNEVLKQSICFQCQSNCIQCQLNHSTRKSYCIKCQTGYFLDQNDCVECSINCLECIDYAYNCKSCKFPQKKNHKCQLCQSGYYADEINGVCLFQCGDYIQVKEEECDDGNILRNDGCDDQCRLEHTYVYINGVSIIPNYPKPLLQSISTTSIYSVIRLFKLYYTTPIIITEGFQIKDYLTFHFSNKKKVQKMDQSLHITQEISQLNEFNQSQLTLIINITFSRTSQDENLLIKFINNSVIKSSEGYYQIEKEVTCLIPQVIYIDEVTISQVQATTQSNTYLLYFIGTICIGSVVFGGVEIFFNLLDTLQMLSYLKYINTQLPYNLQAYFQLFGFAQFNFIQKIFDFSGLIDLMLNSNNLKKIPTKVASDDITSLFIINTATITTVWISLLGIYAIAKVIPKILYSFKFKFYSESEEENSWLIKIGVYYLTIKYVIIRICYAIISEFFYSGILRVHMATAYDLTFSVFLQLYAFQLNSTNFFIKLSSLLACVAIIIYIFSIYFVIQISQMKKYSFNCIAIRTKYGSVFDGIKIHQFSQYLNALLLIKKFMFMFLLVFAYEFPAFQTVSITLLSIMMSLFLILFNPIEDKFEYYKQLVCEINICFTLLNITILTFDFELSYFTQMTRQSFGWGCIFFMTAILCIQLGVDGFQQWRFIFKKYKQIRKIADSILRLFSKNDQEAPKDAK